MEEQVVSIYAGIKGKVDDIEVAQVRRFEAELHEYMRRSQAALMSEIREKKALDDALAAKLGAAIDEFKATFK